MFSAIILVCNIELNQCVTMPPPFSYKTEELCEQSVTIALEKLKTLNPENEYTFKCVDWGTAT